MTDIQFINAHLIDPSQNFDGIGYVTVENGVISDCKLGDAPKPPKNTNIIDCKQSYLSPGLVDMRVQSGDPGVAHLEDLNSLLHATATAGITAFACLPNTQPIIDDASMIDSLSLRATRIGGARLRLYGAATRKLRGKAMAELGLMAEAGAVGFSNGTRCIMDSLVMRRLLAYTAMLDRPFIQHCEDHNLTAAGEMNEGETSTRLGLIGAPAEAEASNYNIRREGFTVREHHRVPLEARRRASDDSHAAGRSR